MFMSLRGGIPVNLNINREDPREQLLIFVISLQLEAYYKRCSKRPPFIWMQALVRFICSVVPVEACSHQWLLLPLGFGSSILQGLQVAPRNRPPPSNVPIERNPEESGRGNVNRSASADPLPRIHAVQMVMDLCTKMRWGSIMLVPHLTTCLQRNVFQEAWKDFL